MSLSEILAILTLSFGQVMLAAALAAIVHEGGHALTVLAVGLRLRVVVLGLGPTLLRLRLGSVVFILKAMPLTGYVMLEPTARRWARTATIAAGPLANAAALGAVAFAWRRSASDILVALAIFQALFCVTTLMPLRGTVSGIRSRSDGLQLYHLICRHKAGELAATYALILSSVQPKDAPAHPLTRHAAPILFEIMRSDRVKETWAKRDACRMLEARLAAPDLTRAERVLILCLLPSMELLFGGSGLTLAALDAFSAEAIALAPEPMPCSTRGAVRLAQGHVAEGETLLQAALAGFAARGDAKSADAAVCLAFLGQAAAADGRAGEAADRFAAAAALPIAATGEMPAVLAHLRARVDRSDRTLV